MRRKIIDQATMTRIMKIVMVMKIVMRKMTKTMKFVIQTNEYDVPCLIEVHNER